MKGGEAFKAEGRPGRGETLALALTVAAGLACAALLQSRLDAVRPPEGVSVAAVAAEDEDPYLSPAAIRRLGGSFRAIAADYYWMKSLQYVGRKLVRQEDEARGKGEEPPPLQIDDLSGLGLRNLARYLDFTTTLDPQFMPAYEYAAVVLTSVDEREAIRILERGVAENPESWRLRTHLGYIFWQKKEYERAAEEYLAGSRIQGAPPWVVMLAAKMKGEGGSRETARQIYLQLHEQSDDPETRRLAVSRLNQLRSLDEREGLDALARTSSGVLGRCPNSWGEMMAALKRAGKRPEQLAADGLQLTRGLEPLDPTGVPYRLVPGECRAELGEGSQIPRK